jgi:hypothetical protein
MNSWAISQGYRARRLGGLHRRKKRTLATIYGFGGLRSIEDGQALLETITIETLALENSIARNRAITAIVATGAKLIELGDLADRVAAIEAATKARHAVRLRGPADRSARRPEHLARPGRRAVRPRRPSRGIPGFAGLRIHPAVIIRSTKSASWRIPSTLWQ